MQFVDTNIFVRYLTRDDLEKAEACLRLFEQARLDKIKLTSSESIMAEVVFVLSSKNLYGLSRQEIKIRLYPLITLPGLKLSNKLDLLRAIDIYANNNIDFEDALSIAIMERQEIGELYSYDKDFDRIQGTTIKRIEP
jgi:predicted nucleic acid-binding protein